MDNWDVKKLSHDVAVAQRILAAIDEELSAVITGFSNPNDASPTMRKVEKIIDHRLAKFSSHPLIGPVVAEMTQQYLTLILDKHRPTLSTGLRLVQTAKVSPFSKLHPVCAKQRSFNVPQILKR